MIYHTAAEINYYNAFFMYWYESILKHSPNAKISLKFVGSVPDNVLEFCQTNNISLIVDDISFEDLVKKYGKPEKAKGYYPMSRWNSIPNVDDHVCVTDIDVVMLRNEEDLILDLFQENEFVSISRDKKVKINPMMVNYLRKDICKIIKEISLSFMDSKDFKWDIDLEVMSFMKKNFTHKLLHKLGKFDVNSNLYPTPELLDMFFMYYSAVSINVDGVEYPGGLEAKKIKYERAKQYGIF